MYENKSTPFNLTVKEIIRHEVPVILTDDILEMIKQYFLDENEMEFTDYEGEIESLKDEISSLEGEIEDLEWEIEDLKSELGKRE